jgi:NAD-dependent dihydropyrimidine dehydrogenase PreA subunit
MKRKIITIDEDKCNGCGACIPDCPEGALQVIDGKARLISDLFCDGLGACVHACPLDAMHVVEREAEPYDERRVMDNIVRQGPLVIQAHLEHLKEHGEHELLEIAVDYLNEKNIRIEGASDMASATGCGSGSAHNHSGGCPGSRAIDLGPRNQGRASQDEVGASGAVSELRSWPVQLKLLNPGAPYLKNADLLISADCVPFAFADFHKKFLKGRVVITFCPKLDPYSDEYIDKLAMIFREQNIQSISIVKMEVPCCGGVLTIVKRALEAAGKTIFVKEFTVSIGGELI